MTRAIFEFLFTIFAIWVARAVLTSIFRGLSSASAVSQRPTPQPKPPEGRSGNLHKDPVCGTYVSEETRFHRQLNGQTIYYCSQECREKHALVAH